MQINADGKKVLGPLITQTKGFCFKNKGIENTCQNNKFLQITTQKISLLLEQNIKHKILRLKILILNIKKSIQDFCLIFPGIQL